MSLFSAIETRRPPGSVIVPPNAWATAWRERPNEAVCIGLRFVPDAELEDARVEAYRRAARLYPDHVTAEAARELFVASFQDALARWIVVRGTCDPNDATQPYELFASAPEAISEAMTDSGLQRIFDAWERMRIESDISLPIATDEDLEKLTTLLTRLPALELLSRPRALRLRRLMQNVLEELETLPSPER